MVILSKLCPPRAWFGGVALCWGVIAMLMVRSMTPVGHNHRILSTAHNDKQATAFNFPSFLIARIVLGIFEAGFSPAVPLYLCLPLPPLTAHPHANLSPPLLPPFVIVPTIMAYVCCLLTRSIRGFFGNG